MARAFALEGGYVFNEEQVREAARLIIASQDERRQMPPLVERYAGMTLDDAYRVQLELVRERVAAGGVVVGKKVALTNRLVQESLGVNEPVFGHLFADMLHVENDVIEVLAALQPRIEPEIAFIMASDLRGPGVTVGRALAAVAGVVPAFEIPAGPILDWRVTQPDIAACNAFASKLVIGGTLTPVAGLDLRLIGAVLEGNGSVISTGAGAAVMGNPADVVAWLANRLAQYGQQLNAGDVVLAGALTLAPDVHAGDYYKATFDRLGSVVARFQA
jgi:2-keto-4-pentenoate hydratase